MFNNLDFLWRFVHSCSTGVLSTTDCAPVWQLAVIAGLLVVAVVALLVLRLRAAPRTGTCGN